MRGKGFLWGIIMAILVLVGCRQNQDTASDKVKAGKNGVWDKNKSPASYSWSIYLVSSIDSGWAHTCALASNGGVKCWGWNYRGQLGNGNNNDSNVPVDVSGLSSGVSAISAGGYGHTCGLLTSGGIKCWGNNWAGQLGNGNNTKSNVPVNVLGFGP